MPSFQLNIYKLLSKKIRKITEKSYIFPSKRQFTTQVLLFLFHHNTVMRNHLVRHQLILPYNPTMSMFYTEAF